MSHKILSLLIQEVLLNEKKNKKPPGAGIVVVKDFDGEWKVLALSLRGLYDIPKGIIEPDEDALSAAMRETVEEASISNLDFKWDLDSFKASQVTVYVAATTQDPSVTKNPETGILEHDSAQWVEWDDMLSKVYGYLKPAVLWAREKVESSQ
tara:strand:+ start:258 stop:713 length:456 start_codon:yes stop_codon:yes gene_type:complete